MDASTHLSAYLALGCISPRWVLQLVLQWVLLLVLQLALLLVLQ